ncbi:MAG: hypothetical protein KJZ52_10730, partial [Anaerolineales bacterium]|nr:hypothetical protein [Anaerolineales bacterium]
MAFSILPVEPSVGISSSLKISRLRLEMTKSLSFRPKGEIFTAQNKISRLRLEMKKSLSFRPKGEI